MKDIETNHAYTIGKIHEAFERANFTKVSLDETLSKILEKFYWDAVDDQKEDK